MPAINELPFIPWKEWPKRDYHPILLIDPTTGQEIGEVTGMQAVAKAPSGQLLFAGDPHYAGVINTIFNDERHMSIVGSIRLGHPDGDQQISARARDLTKVMVPGQLPQARLFTMPSDIVRDLGPWLADHPEKPSRRG